jgi:hypothetical protein
LDKSLANMWRRKKIERRLTLFVGRKASILGNPE